MEDEKQKHFVWNYYGQLGKPNKIKIKPWSILEWHRKHSERWKDGKMESKERKLLLYNWKVKSMETTSIIQWLMETSIGNEMKYMNKEVIKIKWNQMYKKTKETIKSKKRKTFLCST